MASPVAAAPEGQLDALFLPFAQGELALPADARVLFLRARGGRWLREWAGPDWLCEQGFKPFADDLERAGLTVGEAVSGERYDRVLVLPPRQREEARAVFARAACHASPGGCVLAAVPNAEGAKSAQADFARLFGPVRSLSKHKCRVFWAMAGDPLDRELLDQWIAWDEPRRIADGYLSRPGLFAWDRIDPASALLAAHLPGDLRGRLADLGAGYGYLSAQAVARCQAIVSVDLYEAQARALGPAQANLDEAVTASGRQVDVRVLWHDVTRGLPYRYDAIVSNPPFHQGRADLPELGRRFITVAAAALHPGGRLWMVANRHLPYEATLASCFAQVRTVATQDGFKVIEAVLA
ncbi:MAG TPA: class I SAM-dependent methyltransferase [Frateuria sp.]|uniref:class I SAM-dependent methyltransferase n=1 Tax=Frateuria sp. TaxID=2211372 RepID=UPI002DED4A08|nr:class I SAM-dependent methyltransferase [Frateuria sp.]